MASLFSVFERSVADHPGRPAVRMDDLVLSYADLALADQDPAAVSTDRADDDDAVKILRREVHPPQDL